MYVEIELNLNLLFNYKKLYEFTFLFFFLFSLSKKLVEIKSLSHFCHLEYLLFSIHISTSTLICLITLMFTCTGTIYS